MPIITKPNLHFNPVLYFGNGGTQTVSGVGFEPGLAWIKSRGSGNNNCLVDSIRGAGYILYSDATSSEGNLTSYFTGFNSDGFSFALGGGAFNAAYNYVAWNWKAGGAAVTNTAGSISSQVSANPTAGFSIVTYTGNGTLNATIGHGLGVAPSMVIIKNRGGANNWDIYHISNGAQKYLDFTTAAVGSLSTIFPTTPTSSVVYLGTTGGQNTNASTYVAYCWAPIAGYSAFGSYTSNNSTDGPFIYTGFRPRYVLIKAYSNAGESWNIFDSARGSYNVNTAVLFADASSAEATNSSIDFLSNGFKLRSATGGVNYSSYSYIYMAFAEAPFKFANAR